MGRPKRAEQFDPGDVCVVHCIQRCVRRSFLAGKDHATGRDYSHRRAWIRRRMEGLASVFGVDVLAYAVMSNHIHVVLRTRPDVVQQWSDEEVAVRWLQLYPGQRTEEHLGEPTDAAIEQILNTPDRVAQLRRRLSDVSWFMKALCEPIARMANRQDGCVGRFWEGRFKAQRIVDEAGLLACTMYVDLNPIRASMAQSPEESQYTSAYDRILALKKQHSASADSRRDRPMLEDESIVELRQKADRLEASGKTEGAERIRRSIARLIAQRRAAHAALLRREHPDAWLAPLEVSAGDPLGPQCNAQGVRSSDKGFLAMTVAQYLKLLDWTGRQSRVDKRGKIPAELAPVFERLGIEPTMWGDLVWGFSKYFGRSRAAGSPDGLRAESRRSHRHWVRGQRAVGACFTQPATASP